MTDKDENTDELLFRILNGEASCKDIYIFKEWIATGQNQLYFQKLKRIWHATTYSPLSEAEQTEAFNRYRKYLNRNSPGYARIKRIIGYAALVLLSMGTGYWLASKDQTSPVVIMQTQPDYGKTPSLVRADGSVVNLVTTDTTLCEPDGTLLYRSGSRDLEYKARPSANETEIYNTIYVPRGERFNLTLSDGTRVWLNSETTLRFPVNFVGNERKVFLTGQAFFEVVSDSLHPFLVQNKQLQTRVLGTSFDMSVYPEQAQASVTLVDGRVEALLASGEKRLLSPDQQLRIDTSGHVLAVASVNAREWAQWKDGILRIDNETFPDMLDKLSRWYGVTFINEADIASSDRFNGKFHREDIEAAMHAIALSADVGYTCKGDVITIYPR